MINLKKLLKESTWANRKFGEPLPTLNDYMKEDIITEGKELDQKTIDKIAALTDRNNHTEARIVLAKTLGNSAKIVKAYEAIDTIHMFLGRANETNVARDALDKILFNKAKGYSNFSNIWGAF